MSVTGGVSVKPSVADSPIDDVNDTSHDTEALRDGVCVGGGVTVIDLDGVVVGGGVRELVCDGVGMRLSLTDAAIDSEAEGVRVGGGVTVRDQVSGYDGDRRVADFEIVSPNVAEGDATSDFVTVGG